VIVVDASLAAKWILWEDGSHDAIAFLSRYRTMLCAPDLIVIEVSGAITRVARMAEIDDSDASQMLDWWLGDFGSAALELRRSSAALVRAATRLSIDVAHPVQDCLYLALAIELDADLVTCDAKFQRKVAQTYRRVRLLSDYRNLTSP